MSERPTLDGIARAALARAVPPAAAALPEFAGWPWPAATLDLRAALASLRRMPVPDDQPLLTLATRLQLTDLDLLACALALVVEFDPLCSAAVAALQARAGRHAPGRPTLGLVARMAAAAGLDAAPSLPAAVAGLLFGPAMLAGVLQAGAGDCPAAERSLALCPQLLAALAPAPRPAGDAAALCFGAVTVQRIMPPAWRLPPSWVAELGDHAALLQTMRQAGPDGVSQLVLRADLAHEASALAAALGALLQRPVLRITRGLDAGHGLVHERAHDNAHNNAHDHAQDNAHAPLPPGVEAWCLLQDALLLFEFELAPGEQASLPALRHQHGVVLVAVGAEGDVAPARQGGTLQWRIQRPPACERAMLWRGALGSNGAGPDVEALAHRYSCGVSTLHAAASAARMRAAREGVPLADAHVRAAFCDDLVATTHGLSALAQWVPARGIADAFVADGAVLDELQRIVLRCLWREQAGAALGPAIAARYAAGVKLLFIGASGTGKTLAAMWLAEHLGKPLYRVDTAAVTSKYIGETEKNLSRLLARAEQLDCVLLFDEADSAFGARTDVAQANDRYANAQTNYLLQRIETFAGVVVLTSNSKARFDDAFMRRLDHVLDFPLPRGAARTTLWRRHLGQGHSLDEVQLRRLAAEIDLPGGNIRNIVLSALLQATQQGGEPGRLPISFAHVVRAASGEYSKLGRRLPDGLKDGLKDGPGLDRAELARGHHPARVD